MKSSEMSLAHIKQKSNEACRNACKAANRLSRMRVVIDSTIRLSFDIVWFSSYADFIDWLYETNLSAYLRRADGRRRYFPR
jgi:hypothetical protein